MNVWGINWVSTAGSAGPFPFSTLLVSTCGPANLNPFQPNSFEPSLVLLVVWHHSAMVPCWELYLMAFSGALNELRNYKKLPEVCLTFRCTACSLPDTTESTVIAWSLHLVTSPAVSDLLLHQMMIQGHVPAHDAISACHCKHLHNSCELNVACFVY